MLIYNIYTNKFASYNLVILDNIPYPTHQWTTTGAKYRKLDWPLIDRTATQIHARGWRVGSEKSPIRPFPHSTHHMELATRHIISGFSFGPWQVPGSSLNKT